MPRKRHKPEEIVAKLRQVDVLVSQGQSVADAVRWCRRGCGGNWLSVISRAGRVVGSGGEVNRERCGRLGEALPSIDLAHGDLA
jgi:hypothetical protein